MKMKISSNVIAYKNINLPVHSDTRELTKKKSRVWEKIVLILNKKLYIA